MCQAPEVVEILATSTTYGPQERQTHRYALNLAGDPFDPEPSPSTNLAQGFLMERHDGSRT